MNDLFAMLYDVSAWVIPVVIAVTFHEAAHGYVARRMGDDTAFRAGRVTFNPIKHFDRFGTLLLPGILLLLRSPVIFGYAKPVPVNFRALRPFRLGVFCVALAGPGINIALAFISGLLLHLEVFITPEQAPWLYMNLYRSMIINIVLAVFNMIPILPLDGGRVLFSLLPPPLAQRYAETERYGMLVVVALLLIPPLLGFSLIGAVVAPVAGVLMDVLLYFTGNLDRLTIM